MTCGIDQDALEAALARVRPLVLGHGGDIEIEMVEEDGVVFIHFFGACRACPNMAMTYIGPVRTNLMAVRGVKEVRCKQVNAGPRCGASTGCPLLD